MPRFFFNLMDGAASIDHRGIELADLTAARSQADLIAETFLVNDPMARAVVVTDEDGVELYRTEIDP